MRIALPFMLLASVATSGGMPQSALAQSAAISDSLPRELVMALLGGRGVTDVRVGRAADVIPEGFFREGRVLGSSVYGGSSTTIAEMPYAPDVVLDTLRARLIAAGWTSPPAPPAQRGFVTSGFSGMGNWLCREGERVTPAVSARRLDRTIVSIAHYEMQGGSSLCSRPAEVRRSFLDDSPIPPLYPPPGVTSMGGGSGGGGDRFETRTQLNRRLPVADVLRHYATQLMEANWTAADEALSSSAAMAVFSVVTPEGRNWHGVLSVIAPPNSPFVEVFLTVRRL